MTMTMAMAMKGNTMGVNSLRATTAPDLASYTSDAALEAEIFETEDENETADRSSIIQTGWAAAKQAVAKSSTSYPTDFRPSEEAQLIKFISNEPMTFMQHWINRPGKKSFISIGEGDPLIEVGSKPDQKFAFTVVNLQSEDPQPQLWIVGVRLCSQLEKFASNPKTGPLNRTDMYWEVSKSGSGTQTTYNLTPVKERDLAEDWDLDPVKVAELVKTMKPLGPEALHTSTKSELAAIAREISSGQAAY